MPDPQNWPSDVAHIPTLRLARDFSPALIPLISSAPGGKYAPQPTQHPSCVMIKRIAQFGHPANGQCGLFAKRKIAGGEMIIPYLGVVHASFQPSEELLAARDGVTVPGSAEASVTPIPPPNDHEHETSDYDLSLLRLSASDIRNPFPGYHVSIGVDAAKLGNAARMVNDYRGIPGVTAPNAEFRQGRGPGGELRMEVWSLKCGVDKGQEVLVSYGKGWWSARKGAG